MLAVQLKHQLPPSLITPLHRLYRSAKLVPLQLTNRFRFAAALYYTFFSGAFWREQRSVVAGLVRYYRNTPESSFFLLRRNTHRLEKGLLMRPQRTLFALDYLVETVRCYRRCARSPLAARYGIDLAWSRDVLSSFFAQAGEHPIVAAARREFDEATSQADDDPSLERIPYRRDLEGPTVSYDDLWMLSRRRRSVRWFLPKPVPRELLDRALLLAAQAPSSCNRQPYNYYIYDQQDIVRELSTFPLGTRGFAENIPVLCVVTGDLSAYFSERDRHGIYVDASLSIMSFLFALESLGLSSCTLNWPDIEALERRIERRLRLPHHRRVIMFIAIGWPDPEGKVAYSQKRDLNELRSYNPTDLSAS